MYVQKSHWTLWLTLEEEGPSLILLYPSGWAFIECKKLPKQ